MNESIEPARFLRRQPARNVETLYLACDLGGQRARIEARDAGDSGFSRDDVAPGFVDAYAYRRNDAEARDDYSAPCQLISVDTSALFFFFAPLAFAPGGFGCHHSTGRLACRHHCSPWSPLSVVVSLLSNAT